MLTQRIRVIIVTHDIVGNDERVKLLNYLSSHGAEKVVFIGQPRPGAAFRHSVLIINDGVKSKKLILPRWKHLGYLSYFMDIVTTLFFLIRAGSTYDIYIGFGVSYTPLGLILRRLRVVRKVVFWTTDYFPTISNNSFVNALYNAVQKSCAESSDYMWDVSPLIMDVRTQKGLKIREEKSSRCTVYAE